MVVRIDRERALGWSIEEVLRRWTVLFTGPLLVTRYLSESRVCQVPSDCIPRRSYPLLQVREVLRLLAGEADRR